MESANQSKSSKKGTPIHVAIILVVLSILTNFALYFFISKLFPRVEGIEIEQNNSRLTNSTDGTEVDSSGRPAPRPQTDEDIDDETLRLISEFTEIDGQHVYIYIPETKKEILGLIIYSHGSTDTITENTSAEFEQLLMRFGDAAILERYIFAASNMHGESWGNEEAVSDMNKLIDYIEDKYLLPKQITLVGYSMGGLATNNFLSENDRYRINRVAYIAPSPIVGLDSSIAADKLKNTEFKIWHGDQDVNIDISFSKALDSHLERLGIESELVVLEGKDHWYARTELVDEVIEFLTTVEESENDKVNF